MKIVSGASGAAHWSGCSLPPHRIDVEDIIAYLPQRRLVVLAIDGDVAGGALDRGRGARVQRELIVPIELGKEVSRRRPFVGRAEKEWGRSCEVVQAVAIAAGTERTLPIEGCDIVAVVPTIQRGGQIEAVLRPAGERSPGIGRERGAYFGCFSR